MKRQINFRFLGVLIAIGGIFALGGHYLHGHQLKRNAGYLLQQSKQALSRKDYTTALNYLSHYLTLRPDDGPVRARFGVVLARVARTPKSKELAFFTLERALRENPELERDFSEDPELQDDLRSDDKENAAIATDLKAVRRRTAVLAMDLFQYTDAKVHIELSLKNHPRDGELFVLLGRCEEAIARHVPALEAYGKAVEVESTRIEGYVRKSALLRRLDRLEEANTVIEDMIRNNASSVRARLAAVRYYRDRIHGNPDKAKANLAIAQSNENTGDKDVLLEAADLAMEDQRVAEAREKLERGLKEFPDEPQFYFLLASLETRAKNRARAVSLLLDSLKILPKQSAELWTVADMLIDANEPAQAKPLLERLEKEGASAEDIDFLQAQLFLNEGQSKKAEELLVRCRPFFAKKPQLAIRTEFLLTLCYERLGNTDLRLKAAQALLNLDRTAVAGRIAYASALVASGKTDEAMASYRSMIGQEPAVRFVIARLDVAQNRSRAIKDRNLAIANEMLSGVPEKLTRTVEYQFVRAEVLAAEGTKEKIAEARRVIAEARNRFPKEPQFWVFLAQIAAVTSLPGGFAELDLAQAELGDHVLLRLARASLLLQSAQVAGRPVDRAALRLLESGGDQFPDSEQTQLYRGLAEAQLRAGSAADAERLLRLLADRHSGDLLILSRLFEVIAAKANPEEYAELKEKIRLAEGEDGAIWRFVEAHESWIRYLKDQKPDNLQLAKARLIEAGKRRSDWFRISLLEGEIEDRLGHVDAAIEKYLAAIRQGARQPDLAARTTYLLIARGRHDEVRDVIDAARRWSPEASPELTRLDAINLFKLGEDPDQVLKKLEEGAPETSDDFKIHLFRGALLSELRRTKEAEAAYRRAAALSPKSPECTVSLVGFLARNDRQVEAKAEIEKALAGLPAERRQSTLGQCYELVGDRPTAEKYYLQAAQESGGQDANLGNLITFYIGSGEPAKAEPILLRLIANSQSKAWARRTLAGIMATSGDYARGTAALEYLESNLRESPGNPADLRLRSFILATRPGERGQTIKALEATPTSGPSEEYLLAQLYELDGNWPKANERFLGLLAKRGGDNPVFMAHYVRALLRHDELSGAESWLVQLEKREKREPKKNDRESPRVVELRARLKVKQGDPTTAANLLKKYAQDTFKELSNPIVLQTVGLLMAELKLTREAEEMLKQYVAAAEMKTPAAALVMAEFLARQNRVGEALAICSTALAKVNPEPVASMAVAVVRIGQASVAQFAQAESIIQNASQKKPESLDIPISLADLRDAQGQYDEAKRLYREIIGRSPRSALAMNNLSWLLALQEGNRDEALRQINRAIDIQGPDGNLLDTLGVIKLTLGDAAEAVAHLTASIAQEPLPERYFHLAQAHQKAGNSTEALRAMRKARDLDLAKEKHLHRLEWKSYDEMMKLIEGR